MPTTCALCRRVVPEERIDDPQVVQEHHLRPERRAESPTVMLCRPCHKQIHALFTNEELREEYAASRHSPARTGSRGISTGSEGERPRHPDRDQPARP